VGLLQWTRRYPLPVNRLKDIENQLYQVQKIDPTVRDFNWEQNLRKEYEEVNRQLEIFWHQRSRVSWMTYGDRNTKFFHNSTTMRRRKNLIVSLQRDDETWTDTEKQTRKLLVDYFKKLYNENSQNEIQLEAFLSGLSLPIVPNDSYRQLLAIPNAVEILSGLKEMGLDKSPSPNGFTVRFLVTQWQIVGSNIIRTIQNAFLTGNAPNQWMLSHLVLIPKRENPCRPEHFRPLSVCSVYYRLLTKIIANRVKPLLPDLISYTQTTFLKGRSIQENVLLLDEVLHSFQMVEFKTKAFTLKADLFKAFDTLGWRYLEKVLRKYNFPQQLTNLILSCVIGSKFSIKLNGVVGDGFIKPKRGAQTRMPVITIPIHIIHGGPIQVTTGSSRKGMPKRNKIDSRCTSTYTYHVCRRPSPIRSSRCKGTHLTEGDNEKFWRSIKITDK
jgi:Reverse transcriptase (RNA-dependent DNA polymerase)